MFTPMNWMGTTLAFLCGVVVVAMADSREVDAFYDRLAPHYHMIFGSWEASQERQAEKLFRILTTHTNVETRRIRVLDAAAGIGTQTLGLAKEYGEQVEIDAGDLSEASIARLQDEVVAGSLCSVVANTRVSDLRNLGSVWNQGAYDVVLAMDNAIPHLLTREDVKAAFESVADVLSDGGVFIFSVRNYESCPRESPKPVVFHDDDGGKRIYVQVWDWDNGDGDDVYDVSLYVIEEKAKRLPSVVTAGTTRYRAWTLSQLSEIAAGTGLSSEWLVDSGLWYQPVCILRRL